MAEERIFIPVVDILQICYNYKSLLWFVFLTTERWMQ